MIQLVPPVNEAAIDFIEENIKDMQSVTKMLEDGLSPEEIALKGLKGLDGEILDSWEAQYYCDCSRARDINIHRFYTFFNIVYNDK